jgi:hypothetical protein
VVERERSFVPGEEHAVRAWMEAHGFRGGDLRSRVVMPDFRERSPMSMACQQGELHVCKWLYDNGAAAAIT